MDVAYKYKDRIARDIFQIPTRREPDHLSLLTVELETIS